MIDNNKIVEALRTVKSPVTGQDVITARMLKDLKINENQVNFTLVLPSLKMDDKQALNFACMSAIQQIYPDADVNIHTITQAPDAQSEVPFPHIKNIIAVASGKGGVGKSTVAVNLAIGLQQLGAKVGIMDADLYGPSIPTMLGLQGQRPKVQNIQGKPKILPLEAFNLQVMSIGFIVEPEQAVVLRGPRLSGIIRQFFHDTTWQELDYLIVDLPPGTGDIQLTLVQTAPITGAIIVTTPQEVAVVDAVKAMNMFLLPSVDVPILGVVENMAWFTPAELPDNKYYIFGKGGGDKMAKLSNSMVLGQIPLVQSIREGGDSGKPAILQDTTDAFLTIAKNTAQQLVLRHEFLDPTKSVNVS